MLSLNIGKLPDRKSVYLYLINAGEYVATITPLARFVSQEASDQFIELIRDHEIDVSALKEKDNGNGNQEG